MSEIRYAASRQFDVYAGGAPKDTAFIGSLTEWLSTSCGFEVAPPGDDAESIASARSFVFTLTREGAASTEVLELMRLASREAREHASLRFVVLVRDDLGGNELPPFVGAHSIVRVRGDAVKDAVAILDALYPVPPGLDAAAGPSKDIYFSRSWLEDPAESVPADEVCVRASELGFRLIGDTEDPEFDPVVRLPEIMAGCGGFIAVLPYRGGPRGTSQWMLEELMLANTANLPCLIVKDSRVAVPEEVSGGPNVVALVDYSPEADWTAPLDTALHALNSHYRQPENPADVLYLTAGTERVETVRNLALRITGMALTTLDRPLPGPGALLDLVRGADVVLCDLPGADAEGWMAAGCAIALARRVEFLMAVSETGGAGLLPSLPVYRYTSELDKVGQLHRILRRHRRKTMNSSRTRPAGEKG